MLPLSAGQVVCSDLFERGIVDEVLAVMAVYEAGVGLDGERVVLPVAFAGVADIRTLKTEVGGLACRLACVGGLVGTGAEVLRGWGLDAADYTGVILGRSISGRLKQCFDMRTAEGGLDRRGGCLGIAGLLDQLGALRSRCRSEGGGRHGGRSSGVC